ncbi:MAG TPA: NAD-dependent epimerase/dehydratase family protein [Candidatus Binatia bacterium]|jgi:dihydroflavonol-4-reductase|nr:NAD-dependent epimerase/dehydratase family protein [Candidatus Binatia bacterium]
MPLDLVTGATGLVGGNLVRALVADGRRVRVLVRRAGTSVDGLAGVEAMTGDVTDPESLTRACDGVEHVYHCAALVSMWPRLAADMWRVNVDGTDHVLDACRRAGVRRLIHCSSVDAIGLPEGDAPSTESTAWNWDRLGLDNPYARTKWESQRRVLAAATHDVDAVVVNPTYMFGAWDARPSSGRMILEVAAGRAVGWTSGGNNVVDVEDVVLAMIAAAARGVRGESYILGNENLTYRDIFGAIAAVLGVRPPRLAIPYPLARVGGWLGDLAATVTGKEPGVNTLTARLGYVGHYYDPGKARAVLGMRRTPIRIAIARAVTWFRQAGMLA